MEAAAKSNLKKVTLELGGKVRPCLLAGWLAGWLACWLAGLLALSHLDRRRSCA